MKKFKKVHVDFETRSNVDLLIHGTDRYAKDPSTDITVMVYGFDDEPLKTWFPGLPLPADLLSHVSNGGEFWAHNVTFEWYIWNFVAIRRYKFPVLRISQCYCTMSMANAMGLMGSLEGAAQTAGLATEKDKEGYRVMLMTCKPKEDGTFWERDEVPGKFILLDRYCAKDVDIERMLSKRLAPLSEQERKVWLIDQRINYRGFSIDKESARMLDAMVDKETSRLVQELRDLTGEMVPTPASHAKFKQWLAYQGVITNSIAKDAIKKLLEEDEMGHSDCYIVTSEGKVIPPVVKLTPLAKRAILIRKEASKSSNAKIKMMLNLEVEGRVRNVLEYYGAKQTGRFAGRKLQPQNFPKGQLSDDDIEDIVSRLKNKNAMQEISALHGNVMNVTSGMIRSLIVTKPGDRLLVSDWSNIEGRGLAWLAGEEWKLKAFKDFDGGVGEDLYKVAYAKSFHIDVKKVDKDQRQIGKTLELACGYQGAGGAFLMMAKTLGVKVKEERAKELVDAWRGAHKRIVNYWYAVEDAAVKAITTPGTVFSVGPTGRKISYVKKGSFLCCKLPSGRTMYYPYPKYEEVDAPWGGKKMSITYMYQDAESKKWMRGPTYGGSLVENICQAICRDVLVGGILRIEEKGYPVVMHVHDEIVCEVPKGSHHSLKELEELMAVIPKWAEGFPIVAKGFEGVRYKKG